MDSAGLHRLFDDAGTSGTVVMKRLRDGEMIVHEPARAAAGFLPASTFKVPNSMIGLDAGVVMDVDTDVFRWDGVLRSNFPAWNADMNLRDAIRLSCVPVYQQVARRVGIDRYKERLAALDYGNADAEGAPVDLFWLEGNLRISALQQIAFLERFVRGDLPFTQRTLSLVKDIMPTESVPGGLIRAKTGWAHRTQPKIGWWVGWVEHGTTATLFAINLDVRKESHLAARMGIAHAVFRHLGVA